MMKSKANKHPLIAKTLARWVEDHNSKVNACKGLKNTFKSK